MIFNQSYHPGVAGPFQVELENKAAREFPVRPLACMPSWLSVVTTALSLTVLLVCFSLERTSIQIDQYVCMGCQARQAGHGTSYFPTYKAAACHYARSRPCNQPNRGIWLVTIQSRPDRLSKKWLSLVLRQFWVLSRSDYQESLGVEWYCSDHC